MAYPNIDFQVSSAVNTPGVITYNFTVRNNAGTGSATAFDLNFNEAFAAYAPNAALVAGSVRASGSATAARVTSGNTSGDNTVGVSLSTLRVGETLTISFDIERLPEAVPGSSTTSTATLSYDNIAGSSAQQQTTTNTANTTLVIRPVPVVTETVVATSAPDTGSAQYVADNPDLRPGETATVEFVITVPEGDNTAFSVVDRLADAVAAGSGGRLNYVTGSAQVVSVGANLSSLSGRNLLAPTITTADSNANGTQDQVTLNFGGIRNVSDKAVTAADQIMVRLQVQATDVAANERGDVLTNTVTVNNTSAVTGTSTSYSSTPATVSFDVVEPLLTLSKVASAAAGQRLDAGSEVTYTVTLRHAEASSANAYDLVLADTLPAGMTLVAGSLSSSAGTATASGGTVNLALPTYGLAAGPVTLTYRARIGDAAAPGQALSSTATLIYDSQAGTGGRAGAAVTSTASVTTSDFAPGLVQSIASTSLAESGTDRFDAALPDLSVGEAVTYRLTATLAEGSQRLVLTDTLPNGLQLVSAQVESIGANITGSSLRVGAAPATSGSTLTFDFGNVVNAGDNLTDARDQVTVLVTARGVSGAAAGTPLTNNAVAQVFAPGGTAAVAQTTATQAVEVVRPEVAIAKVSSVASADAGDLVTFTVTLSQAAGSTAAAYNLAVWGLMPDGLTLVGGSARASAGTVSETAAGGIAFSLGALALGTAPVTITYQARLSDGVSNGQSLAGPAQLSYATAPTGGTTASGTAAPAPVLVAITNGADSQLSATSLDATSGSNVGPGELVTLRLIGTLGEGAQRVTLAETLPAGLEYVSSRVVSLGNATGSSLAVRAAGTVDAAAGRVNFNFGTLTNPGDNRVDAGDQLVVEVVARVAAGTAAGTQINPSGILTAATPTGTTTTSLVDGDVTLTVVSGTLGGSAFLDNNGNGVQDTGEAAIAGVAVQLLNGTGAATGRATTTDASGNYAFTGLTPGSYAAQFTAPAGRAFTAADRGPDDARDSDANPVTGRSGTVSLTAGQNNRTVDAGFYVPASVSGTGNLVYSDSNANGVRDAGESGLGGATVRLLNASGTVIATTTSGTDGSYGFEGVAPGTYQVEFVAPAGARFSPQDQGGNDAADSDAATATGRTATFTVTSGGSVGSLAAGVYSTGDVDGTGSVAFADSNGNGVRDVGESGLGGITVRLLDATGAISATIVTASDGTYGFTGVLPGTYQVEFVAPPGTGFSPQDQGNNDAVDSDANPATGRSASFAVTSRQSVANLSAGFLTSTTQLGGDVWLDADGNGLRDAGEQLLQGVRVRLLDAAGQPLGPATVTDAVGHYAFLNLQAGSYRVGYAPLIGTAFTAQDRGADEAIDSDASPVNGVSSLLVTLASGVSDLRGGAGLVLDPGRSPNYAPILGLGNGNDGYPGTDYAEIVRGNGGNDSINGLGGNDSFYGGAGNDSLNGHGGDDVLDGGAGNDNVQGQEGDDVLLGGSGDDIGEGGNGNDVLIAGSGADNMQGENGDDYLFGGAGNDILTGNQGRDVVAGGNGDDSLQGADGTDIVIGGRDSGRMSLGGDGHVTGVATGDMLEGNGGADAFVYQAGDGVDLLLDFNPAEGDTLTIYGHTGFQVVERTPEGRMALYLGSNAGFILNNGTFQGETAASTLPGVRFVASTAEAPNAIMGRDVVVPVLAQNWVSNFAGAGPIAVSQDFPAFAAAPDLTNLSGVTFERLVRRGNENEVRFLPPGNEWLEAGGGYDVLVTGEGFRGTRSTALPEDGLRLDLGGGTHLLRGVEAVRFVDGTLHLGPDSAAAQIVRLYEVALGRPADQAGLNAWLDARQRGAPLTSVADAFLQSPEFAQRYGANLSNADYVELLYNNALGRASDPGGKAGWVTGLENGSITRAGALAGFSESAENRARTAEDVAPGIWDASENAAFLVRLYDTTLGRLPDRAGLQAWREGMDAGIFTVTDVVNGFTASAEFKARYGSATSTGDFVELLYNNALDRAADPAGKAAWVNAIDRNVISRANAVLGFSESAEHRALTAANIMNETPDQFGILFA